ncbi:MAG TPA: HD-GYP domain-containing protein [Thermomicrobiales bacterium]|nr:HD-GYP domain-containing protein [Thermomicrobiales bacterium]
MTEASVAGTQRVVTASDILHQRERLIYRVAVLVCLLPLMLFVLLRWLTPALDHTLAVPTQHFFMVSGACVLAFAMAVLVGLVAVRSREPRTYFLATTYIALAAPFSVHGLMTPGMHFADGFYNSLSVSAQLSLVLGAVCIYLASRPIPARVDQAIREQFGAIMTATVLVAVAYVLVCLSFPTVLDWVPTGNEPAGITTLFGLSRHDVGWILRIVFTALGVVCSLKAASTFGKSFGTTRSPASAAVACSALLLAQSVFIQSLGVVWHYSWWLYHGSLLLAVALPMAAFAWLVATGRGLEEIVDALLLTETLDRVAYSAPQALEALVATVERKDPHLKGHMRRVCELSVAIADDLRMTDASVRAIGYAALLHDVGKLGLPPSILHKPGRLTDAEFVVLQQHPGRGFDLVAPIESLRIAAPAVRWHHERLDGRGYPDGLDGREIPIEARVLAVADVWDALTSDRVYRVAMSPTQAWAILAAERGTALDQECVDALARVLARRNVLPMQSESNPLGGRDPELVLAS